MCRMILSVYDTKCTGEPAIQRSDANAAATPIACLLATRIQFGEIHPREVLGPDSH